MPQSMPVPIRSHKQTAHHTSPLLHHLIAMRYQQWPHYTPDLHRKMNSGRSHVCYHPFQSSCPPLRLLLPPPLLGTSHYHRQWFWPRPQQWLQWWPLVMTMTTTAAAPTMPCGGGCSGESYTTTAAARHWQSVHNGSSSYTTTAHMQQHMRPVHDVSGLSTTMFTICEQMCTLANTLLVVDPEKRNNNGTRKDCAIFMPWPRNNLSHFYPVSFQYFQLYVIQSNDSYW